MMFVSERPPLKKMLIPVVVAAGMLGLVNVLEKVVFNQTNFVSGYVWFTIGTFVGSVALLAPASWRKQIFRESGGSEPRNRFWYFVNRIISGVGSLLIYYAVSRTHPAIVDAISGVRYVIVFIGALLLTRFRPQWLKEDFHKWQLISKSAGTLLVVAGLVLVGLSGGKKGGSGSPTASEKPWLGPRPSHSRSNRDRQLLVVATTSDRAVSVARHTVHRGRTCAGESGLIHVPWMTELDIGVATLGLSSASLWRPRLDPRVVGGVKY